MKHQERLEFIQMTQTLATRVVQLSERLEIAEQAHDNLMARVLAASQLLAGTRSAKAAAAVEVLKGNYDGHTKPQQP